MDHDDALLPGSRDAHQRLGLLWPEHTGATDTTTGAATDDSLADHEAEWRTWVAERGPLTQGREPPASAEPRRWVPAFLRGGRFDPGRRGALALALVAVAAATIAAALVWWGRPQAVPLPASLGALPVVSAGESGTARSSPRSSNPGTTTAPTGLVVSVVGKVARPGLVTVPPGARVADVLAAVGGRLPGVDPGALNLARKVADGEQLAVGVPAVPDATSGAAAAAGAPGEADSPAAPGAPLDLNTAAVGQLDALPGVGPVTASRIVEWRTRNGRFTRVEQLREVDGIGERKFDQLRQLVRV